jgi:hypothetical protein
MIAVIGGGMLILGAAGLAFALGLFIRQHLFLASARAASGEVVRHVRRASENGWLYRAVIEFKTEAGRTSTFEDSAETSWIRLPRGTIVPVLYVPARPTEARIDSFVSKWLPSLIAGVSGPRSTSSTRFANASGLRSRCRSSTWPASTSTDFVYRCRRSGRRCRRFITADLSLKYPLASHRRRR